MFTLEEHIVLPFNLFIPFDIKKDTKIPKRKVEMINPFPHISSCCKKCDLG